MGNVVKTIQDGNTTVLICDDFAAKTPEEIEKVLVEYHAAGWAIAQRLIEKGEAV